MFADVVSTVKMNVAGRRVDVPGDVGRADVECVGVLGERAERQRARLATSTSRRSGAPGTSSPGSGELNAKVGVVSCVAAAGVASSVVSGAIVSIRTVWLSTPLSLPIRSKARYLTVVTPSAATVKAPRRRSR